MKKQLLTVLLGLLVGFNSFASSPSTPDEGMWLPMFIERLNYVDMKKMGLQLTAEELYSINNSSLKDAIVSMGFFCTAELVSPEGLMFTNHHCGYDVIQTHSSVEHDYLTDGFWAKNKKEELQNDGLTVSFLVRMEDVTAKVLENLNDDMTESQRSDEIEEVIAKLEKAASEKGRYNVTVSSFFDGNEYYLFVYEQFLDVRLVGAPPSAIGKYGGDTDNWMWPRHTGDFSIFRIYTAPDGSPAEYSKDNIPLKSKHYLPISLKGVKKNDFSMIWGFPGTTDRYLTSYGVDMAINQSNPTVVSIRDKKLEILKEDMNADPAVKIQYSAKYAQCANYWKYFIGETKGLKSLKVYDQKKKIENEVQKWISEDADRKKKYGDAIKNIEKGYKELSEYNVSLKYLEEAVFQGPELITKSFSVFSLYRTLQAQASKKGDDKKKYDESIKKMASSATSSLEEEFKDFNLPTDKKIFAALLEMYYKNVPKKYHPFKSIIKYDKKGEIVSEKKIYTFDIIEKKFGGDFNKWADYVYSKSILVDKAKLEAYLEKPSFKDLDKDPGMRITLDFISAIRAIYGAIGEVEPLINGGNRLFVDALRTMNPDKKYYPNANSTMRMTYGTVLDYIPADAVHYDFRTTMKGLMAKEDPNNDEFIVPEKLKKLYLAKDYGRYSEEGKLYVCFITNHDISGGNSGSPVINGQGHLIGIAFDGNWEAMSGNIAFEPRLQRTINVDIRYVLFIIDKLAGAQNLIDELTIIE
ncbi:S46 family peptidase [Bacteroidota bacterium]